MTLHRMAAASTLKRGPLAPRAPAGQALDDQGEPLPPEILHLAEEVSGEDLSDVRLHRSARARQMGARAFTTGADIYFAPDHYDPGSEPGLRLLGREIAHVVQQRSGRAQNASGRGVAVVRDRTLEAEADRMGEALVARSRAGVVQRHASPAVIQRAVGGGAPAVQAVDQIIIGWAQANLGKILLAYQMKGGWEGWAQVELAIALPANGVPVLREQTIYGNAPARRVDLVINGALGVELKCATADLPDVFGKVSEDLDKLTELGPAIPVGVLVFGATAAFLKAQPLLSGYSINLQPVRFLGGPIGGGLAVALVYV